MRRTTKNHPRYHSNCAKCATHRTQTSPAPLRSAYGSAYLVQLFGSEVIGIAQNKVSACTNRRLSAPYEVSTVFVIAFVIFSHYSTARRFCQPFFAKKSTARGGNFCAKASNGALQLFLLELQRIKIVVSSLLGKERLMVALL